jgi:hypothetical protein
MTIEEKKSSFLIATLLKNISYVGLIVLITIPTFILFLVKNDFTGFQNLLILLGIISGLTSFIWAWHLHFDGAVFITMAEKDIEWNELDSMLIRIFNKKSIPNKSVPDRIEGCYRLIKIFFTMFVLHLLFLIATIIFTFLVN